MCRCGSSKSFENSQYHSDMCVLLKRVEAREHPKEHATNGPYVSGKGMVRLSEKNFWSHGVFLAVDILRLELLVAAGIRLLFLQRSFGLVKVAAIMRVTQWCDGMAGRVLQARQNNVAKAR